MGITEWALKLQKRLSGRKPMGPVNKSKKRYKKGSAGETLDMKADKDSAIGKKQSRNERVKSMLDELE